MLATLQYESGAPSLSETPKRVRRVSCLALRSGKGIARPYPYLSNSSTFLVLK